MINQLFITTVFSVTFSFYGISQSEKNGAVSKSIQKDTTAIKSVQAEFSIPNNDNSYPMKVGSSASADRTKETVLWEIQTMEEKLKIVQADPEMHKMAKKNGWYDQVNAQITRLREELSSFTN